MSNARRDRWLAINFAVTIFVSAFLLFQVQPLVSKYILPWFGGSPAVWTTCMLFFQMLLFGGYAYAHLSQRFLPPRLQGLVHLGLIVLALVMLRVVPSESWKPTDSSDPVGHILLLLAATVGVPYFVLSSTGPLIQAWFARAFPGRIPYRLYSLSNVGSLLALLSYPFLFERVWDVPRQASFWSWGFVVYAALCTYAAISVWMMLRGEPSESFARGRRSGGVGIGAGRRGNEQCCRRFVVAASALAGAAGVCFADAIGYDQSREHRRGAGAVFVGGAAVVVFADVHHRLRSFAAGIARRSLRRLRWCRSISWRWFISAE